MHRLASTVAVAVTALVAGSFSAPSAQADASADPATDVGPRVIVTVERAADVPDIVDAVAAGEGEADRIGPRAVVVEADADAIEDLARRGDVTAVETDRRARAATLPNDPCAVSCFSSPDWHLGAVRAEAAWTRSKGDGVVIAVLDTGVDGSHPEIGGKLAGPSVNTTGTNDGVGDHGTAVAGIAAAATNNGVGVAGMGWNARILSVKVLDAAGDGWVSWIASGVYAAVDRGARVINMSLSSDGYSAALADAVAYAQSRGAVVVAAAGNEGDTAVRYPAGLPGVVSVAAAEPARKLASFSNRGPWVDLAAPGVRIPAPVPGGYGLFDGTSAAAPIVSGAVALLLAQEAGLSPAVVEQRLRSVGPALADGSGLSMLDASALMQLHSPYGGFRGGLRVARADVDGDGRSEVITGAGPGGGPHVLVMDDGGTVRASFFAYSPDFHGGVDVAAADLDGDGKAEIVTSAGAGGGPHIRTFRGDGTPRDGGFYAYAAAFTSGVRVGAGDLDGDGRAEIVTGPMAGGGPHVRAFRGNGAPIGNGFLAYAAEFTAGIDVAAGDLDGDGVGEIVTGAGAGGGPHVQVFSGPHGGSRSSFYAYPSGFRGGVQVGVGDANGDGRLDVLTGAGPGGGPHVRSLRIDGGEIGNDFAFGSFTGGVDVAGSVDGTAWATFVGDSLLRIANT